MAAQPQDHQEPRSVRRSVRFDREKLLRQYEEKSGKPTQVEFEQGGKVFTFPVPQWFNDEQTEALSQIDQTDIKGQARIALGDQYDEFIEAGGQAMDIARVFLALAEEDDVDVVNGTPTGR